MSVAGSAAINDGAGAGATQASGGGATAGGTSSTGATGSAGSGGCTGPVGAIGGALATGNTFMDTDGKRINTVRARSAHRADVTGQATSRPRWKMAGPFARFEPEVEIRSWF
jgi:hypothetical protein